MMLLKHEKTGYIHTRVLSIFAKLRLTLGVLRSSSCALQTVLPYHQTGNQRSNHQQKRESSDNAENFEEMLSEAVLGQPGNGFLHKFCEISAIGCNDSLLIQPFEQVYVLRFGKGILQIVVII